MHVILACAASDLLKQTQQQDLLVPALAHRLRAVRAIKKRLADMPRHGTTENEANSMLATCFALTFQSSTLDDGMPEFMTFIRGIIVVAMQMYIRGLKPMFTNLDSNRSEALIAPKMESLPLINEEWSHMVIESIEALGPWCEKRRLADLGQNSDSNNDASDGGLASEYHTSLLEWARELLVSSLGAYKLLRKQYGWWIMQPHSRFARLINLNDQLMVLLATHWISLHAIMETVTEVEQELAGQKPGSDERTDGLSGEARSDIKSRIGKRGAGGPVDMGMTRWLRWLNPMVEPRHLKYNVFPAWVLDQMEKNPTFFGRSRS